MKPYEIVLLSILGFFALIATLLILGKAKVRIVCREKLRVVLYVLGIPITLVSDRKKEPKLKDLSHRLFPEAAMRRELKRKRRAAKRALAKRKKAERKKHLRAQKKKAKKAAQKASGAPKPSVSDRIGMVTALVKRLYRVSRGRMHVQINRLHLSIGTDDAAKTAILYGIAVQGASYLLAWLKAHVVHLSQDDDAVSVTPDYLSEKTRIDIDIVCSIHFSAALGIGIRMLVSYLTESHKAKLNAAARAHDRELFR